MPRRTIEVALGWKVINWNPENTWKTDTLPRLLAAGVDKKLINRSVYVIRLHGNICIKYPQGESPVVYVGEGRFRSRITQHRKWAKRLMELNGNYTFQVCIATPRPRGVDSVYKDCEAALLQRFIKKFKSRPLWNKQSENRRFDHHQYSNRQLDYALGKRSGSKYEWSVQPMPSSTFYRTYGNTHI